RYPLEKVQSPSRPVKIGCPCGVAARKRRSANPRKGGAFPHGGRRSRWKRSKVQVTRLKSGARRCSRQKEEECRSTERQSLSARRGAAPPGKGQKPNDPVKKGGSHRGASKKREVR